MYDHIINKEGPPSMLYFSVPPGLPYARLSSGAGSKEVLSPADSNMVSRLLSWFPSELIFKHHFLLSNYHEF
jgi:hypothetical protein